MARGAVLRLAAGLLVAVLTAGAHWCVPGDAFAAEAVHATRIAVEGHGPRPRIGGLIYRGGLRLTSGDGRFGGLSDLRVLEDGARLIAISDRGNWVSGSLHYDPGGDLIDLDGVTIKRMTGVNGKPLRRLYNRDAEALTRWPGGGWLVAFEHFHRLRVFPAPDGADPAVPVPAPESLKEAPLNGGIEAAALLPDSRLVLLTEDAGDGITRRGWIGDGSQWAEIRYPVSAAFRPTAAASLPGGDLLVLERSLTLLGGLAARVVKVPAARLAPGAELCGTVLATVDQPFPVDNFEGLAVRTSAAGETFVYLVSDDNFFALQETILLMFELTDRAADPSSEARDTCRP